MHRQMWSDAKIVVHTAAIHSPLPLRSAGDRSDFTLDFSHISPRILAIFLPRITGAFLSYFSAIVCLPQICWTSQCLVGQVQILTNVKCDLRRVDHFKFPKFVTYLVENKTLRYFWRVGCMIDSNVFVDIAGTFYRIFSPLCGKANLPKQTFQHRKKSYDLKKQKRKTTRHKGGGILIHKSGNKSLEKIRVVR